MNPLILSLLLALTLSVSAEKIFSPDSEGIHCVGRFDRSKSDSFRFWYPGSKITTRYTGTDLKIVLNDEEGENFFNIITDGDQKKIRTVRLTKGENTVQLWASKAPETHSIEIFKLTEFAQGWTDFKGLSADDAGSILPHRKKRPLIEFYGDSITCGLGSTDPAKKEDGALEHRNHYVSYAGVTARELGADHISISRSGMGFAVSQYNFIMPQLYNRLNPNDAKSLWGFSKVKPDLVVVNLGQNDYEVSRRPTHVEYKRHLADKGLLDKLFVERYKFFISRIIEAYPDTPIICALGNMNASDKKSPFPGYISKACGQLKKENSNLKIETLTFRFKASGGHPSVKEHQQMAKTLTAFIRRKKLLK